MHNITDLGWDCPAAQQTNRSRLVLLLVMLLLVAGCQTIRVEEWKPVRSEQTSQIHVVSWLGESLPAIARWYTGSEENWPAIARANPNILVEQLNQGDRIFIPSPLVKTRAVMSRIFLDEWLRAEQQSPRLPLAEKTESAPLLVPMLHKLKQGGEVVQSVTPPDLAEPDDDGGDLELFGPK